MTTNRGGGGLKPSPVSASDVQVMRELAATMLTLSRRCEGRLGLDLAHWSLKISVRAESLDQAAPAADQGGQRGQGLLRQTR